MKTHAEVPILLRGAMASAVLGAALSLLLFVSATPYTLVAFMFLAQPLLGLAVVLFALQVFKDLRRGKVL
jgi:hypothetical protein